MSTPLSALAQYINGPMGLVLERMRALYEPVELRMYFAAVISRIRQRAVYGARRTFALPSRTPVLVAKNDSKARALLVGVSIPTVPADVRLTPSPDVGPTNINVADGNVVTNTINIVVLRPDEQLWATSTTGLPASAIVGQEWY